MKAPDAVHGIVGDMAPGFEVIADVFSQILMIFDE